MSLKNDENRSDDIIFWIAGIWQRWFWSCIVQREALEAREGKHERVA